MLEINLIDSVEIEEMGQAKIGRLIRFEQVERQRLKEQSAVNDIARANIVLVALHEIRLHIVELNTGVGRLFVAPDVELHSVQLDLSLYPVEHLHPYAFHLQIAVAR